MAKRVRQASPILGAAAALIGDASSHLIARESRFRHTFEAPVERIDPDPAQARRRFDEAEIATLAATMAARGQLQPILLRPHPAVRDRWLIVAGERRWRAARANGWSTILAIEHDGNPEVASLIENLQRVDLTPVEEARGLQQLIRNNGWTQNEAAAALGKSKAEVSATLRILTLPADALDAVLTSELAIPKNALIELARVGSPAQRDRLLQLARDGALTISAIRKIAQQTAQPPASPAPERRQPEPRMTVRAIDQLTRTLVACRTTGHGLGEAQRQRLLQLRDEIDRILRPTAGSA